MDVVRIGTIPSNAADNYRFSAHICGILTPSTVSAFRHPLFVNNISRPLQCCTQLMYAAETIFFNNHAYNRKLVQSRSQGL